MVNNYGKYFQVGLMRWQHCNCEIAFDVQKNTTTMPMTVFAKYLVSRDVQFAVRNVCTEP